MNGTLVDALPVRAFATGHFALRLDTNNASEITLLAGQDGGDVFADVVSVFEASLHFARKHLGPPKYEPFTIRVGAAAAPKLFDWLAGSLGPNPERGDGAVITVDANFKIREKREFSHALVDEVGIPALDAASKETGYLTVRIQPESITTTAGSGKLSMAATKQKLWRTSHFILEIDGLDCKHVSRIDGFTITRKVNVISSGSGGIALVPDKVEFPNLRITLSQAFAQTWLDWHKSFVIDGNNSNAFERNGSIRFMSIDFQKELSRLELRHLGIIRIGSAAGGAPSQIARLTAELYCEEMVLTPGTQ